MWGCVKSNLSQLQTCLRLPAAHNVPEVHAPDPPAPVRLSITPKVANDGHRTICEVALPVLREVMQESEWESKVPILQAREALRRVDYAGNRFWGANLDYSRKRTVEDIIVSRYYSEVRLSLLG